MPILKNAKHERFAREYAIDRNATKAAARAGYSKATSGTQGSRLLKDAEIAARIVELEDKYLNAADITAERVMEELARIAFAKTEDTVKVSDKNTALRMLAQKFKLIGSDEAANDVAGMLMAQLSAARARSRTEDKP